MLTQGRIDAEAKRVLRRLCEPGAVLAVGQQMETAVIVRETDTGGSLRTAVVDREIAQAMALKDWISCPNTKGNATGAGAGRINRYFITNAGRAALRRLTADDDNRAQGFSPALPDAVVTDSGWDFTPAAGDVARARYRVSESPLMALARRRDKDGACFLSQYLVGAGERLREDFELSSHAMRTAKTCDAVIALAKAPVHHPAAQAAQDRVVAAFEDLGAGLGDVVLRCCCLLEGLETTEKSFGWSARSGKIVLRIALQRLAQHYEKTQGRFGPLIG